MKVLIRGAGVAGLTLAHELNERSMEVTLTETRERIAGNTSWMAGGMLAPWCERASAPEEVLTLGRSAADWWDSALPGQLIRRGTLVVAPSSELSALERFAARTTGHERLAEALIARLEPDLAGRFHDGLYFADEAHLDPRRALTALHQKLAAAGVRFHFHAAPDVRIPADLEANCTGIASAQPGLRSVRGEMLILRTPQITLSRPVRILDSRFPTYVVPRADHQFMVGATMIDTAAAGPVTARSAMALLNAARTLHPAFGDAGIVETGVGLRPAFADHMPRVERDGGVIRINGLYRHGFLLAPAMARHAAALMIEGCMAAAIR